MKLYAQITLLIILIALSIGWCCGLVANRIMYDALEVALHEKAKIIVQVLAEHITHNVIDNEVIPTKEVLQKIIRSNMDIDYAYVAGFDGELFSHSFESDFPRDLAGNVHKKVYADKPGVVKYSTFEGPILDVAYPLINGMSAHVHIGMNEKKMHSMSAVLRNRILILSISVALIGILLGALLSRRITFPLRQLADSMSAFGKGISGDEVDFSGGGQEVKELTIAFNHMISERKKTEEALQEAYNIVNKSPAVAFLWKNTEGWPVEIVSDNVENLFGYAAEEFTSGHVVYERTIHPEDLDRVTEEIKKFSSREGTEDFAHKPYRIVTRNEEVKWVNDRTHIRRDEKGNITYYQGIVEDITDRIRVEEALRESEWNYREIFHNNRDVLFVHDYETGEIVDVNKMACDTFRYSLDEMMELTVGDLSANTPPYTQKEAVQWIVKAKAEGPQIFEWLAKTKNDRLIWFENILVSSKIAGKERILVIGRNITDRKNAEEEKTKLEAQLS